MSDVSQQSSSILRFNSTGLEIFLRKDTYGTQRKGSEGDADDKT